MVGGENMQKKCPSCGKDMYPISDPIREGYVCINCQYKEEQYKSSYKKPKEED